MKRTRWEQDRYRQKRPVELMHAFREEVEALREVRRIVIEDNANLFGTVQCNEVRIADLESKLLSASNTIATLTDQRDQFHAALQALNATSHLRLIIPAAFGVVGSTIRLRSGRYLDLLDPRPDQFTFADIAGALSKVCRFGGQIDSFYSVAEHSIHCAHQTKLDGNGDAAQSAVLLHDAAEAFIGDVVKPLKLILGPPYADLERRIEAVIEQKFAVDFARHKAYIRQIDHAMLIHERRNLFSPDSVEWVGERDVRKIDDAVCLHCWDPAHAEAIFTQAARWLGIEVGQ